MESGFEALKVKTIVPAALEEREESRVLCGLQHMQVTARAVGQPGPTQSVNYRVQQCQRQAGRAGLLRF